MNAADWISHRVSNGISYIACPALEAIGVRHGFTGLGANFRAPHDALSISALNAALGSHGLLTASQVHGAAIWDLRGQDLFEVLAKAERPKADAVVFELQPRCLARGSSCCIGVRVADCVPIIFSAGPLCALVHAGWRGLSSSLIKSVVTLLQGSGPLVAAIGPCAGVECYRVGSEVIDAVGSLADFRAEAENGKYLFDLAGTAKRIILAAEPHALVHLSGVCTMCTPGYHSHRRDGAQSGRNLGFVILEAFD